jgi:hypothetical protein
MAEDERYQDASLSLSPEVDEALCLCGGIGGLIGKLPSDAAPERQNGVHRALADPIRLKILAMLAVQPFCVCAIEAVPGIADSKHFYRLSVLKKAGLIRGRPG